tara:strand:+ start:122 stop:961 length:840 start_codon:yes stop_codon:yes gene_type:complete
MWNARHPDAHIIATADHKIWQALKHNLENVCYTEQCWLRQNFAKQKLGPELLSYTFAPQAPSTWKSNPRQWLNSLDIDKAMKQYEKKFPHFVFIGPSPIDFDKKLQYDECVWEELCKFNLKKLINKGKTMIGIIFNVDPHNKPGAHWISMFIDIKKKYILFFDSTGDPPQKQIVTLMKRIKEQGKNIGIDFTTHISKAKHQLKDTECGIYSIYILTELLQGKKTKEYFLNETPAKKKTVGHFNGEGVAVEKKQGRRIPDDEMFLQRPTFFNLDDGIQQS